ncbi:MAG: hypothetical protein ACI4F2_03020 [Acutalibacteraceae bacterium]
MDKSKRHFNINSNYCRDIKSFLRSIVALLMAVMLIFGSTFAWIEGSKKAETNGNECTVSAGAGLQFIEVSKGDIDKGVLTLGGTENFQDCSSVDGRNIFFPTTGSIRPDTATATITDNIKFRSAVESDFMAVSNDKSLGKYLRKDFIIKSLESGNDDPDTPVGSTKIYIDQSTEFKGDADFLKALRVSLNFNDGADPIVICPGLNMSAESRSPLAVKSISNDGIATTTKAYAYQIGKYFYMKTPVCALKHGESRRVTVTVWLEGTDDKCNEALANKAFEMNLVLSTEDANMRTVTFVDYTPKQWVKNDSATMYVVNSESKTSTWVMSSSDGITYTARIPKNITSIYFQRTTNSDKTLGEQDAHNSWSVGDADDLNSSSTYYAIGRGIGQASYINDPTNRENYSYDEANYGYWVNSSCTGITEVVFNDTDGNFQKKADGYPNIYMWDTMYYNIERDKILGSGWPGCHMDSTGTTNQFKFYMPADSNLKFIISGNGDAIKTDTLYVSDLASTYLTSSFDPNKNYKIVYNGSGGVQSFTQQ